MRSHLWLAGLCFLSALAVALPGNARAQPEAPRKDRIAAPLSLTPATVYEFFAPDQAGVEDSGWIGLEASEKAWDRKKITHYLVCSETRLDQGGPVPAFRRVWMRNPGNAISPSDIYRRIVPFLFNTQMRARAFQEKCRERASRGYTLIHTSSCPDREGEAIYNGIWVKIDAGTPGVPAP